MTPQEERNKRFDEIAVYTNEYGYVHPIPKAEVIKTFLTSEVNLTIEQVEKWGESKRLPRLKAIGHAEWDAHNNKARITGELVDDLLSFLTTLKK